MAIVARGPAGLLSSTLPTTLAARGTTERTPAKEARCWQSLDMNTNMKAIKEETRRHGIPASIRADAWFLLSGAAQLAATASQSYATLAASTADLPDEVIFAVEDELRAVRAEYAEAHRLFASAKGTEALSRIVFAYMQRNPACGYAKGLPHIAALLLTVMGGTAGAQEEHAFWTMVALLEGRLFPHCNGQVMLGARTELLVLQQLLDKREPSLAAALRKLGSDALEVLCSSWFSTAFTRTLPLETVVRVWDCLMVEGSKVAQRVALALIKTCSSSIQSCTSKEVLCRVVGTRLVRSTDVAPLLTLAFRGLGSLSSSVVDAARARALATLRAQQACSTGLLLSSQRIVSAPMLMSVASLSAGAGALVGSGGASPAADGERLSGSRDGSKGSSPWPSPRSTGALLSLVA